MVIGYDKVNTTNIRVVEAEITEHEASVLVNYTSAQQELLGSYLFPLFILKNISITTHLSYWLLSLILGRTV